MNYSERIQRKIVSAETSIIETMKLMDESYTKLMLVFDGDKFVGIVTNGDLQRAIIANIPLNTSIEKIVNNETKIDANINDKHETIKKWMIAKRAELMPIVDNDGRLVDVIFWDEILADTPMENNSTKINLPIVVMAGGKGTRLAPLTNVYPKPLIPVGDKTIVEAIMDKFVSYGCHDFYMSVNYKADTIKNYFDFIDNREYNINYFQEDRPLGTAGSLRLLKDKINSTFFVSNCDILIEEDYSEILNYHRTNKNELTVVAAIKTFSIPYGTISTSENGLLESIEEKPTLSFKINTGLYILEPSLLNDIPDDFYHITDLMVKLKTEGRRVGVYPISQNAWKDMGDWNEYLRMIKVL